MGAITPTEYALFLIAVAYVVSLFRDWRPAKQLREELGQQRVAFKDLQKRYDDLEHRYDDLEKKCLALEKSRDFEAAFSDAIRVIEGHTSDRTRDIERLLAAFGEHEKNAQIAFGELARDLASLTSAVSVLAAGIHAGAIPAAVDRGK